MYRSCISHETYKRILIVNDHPIICMWKERRDAASGRTIGTPFRYLEHSNIGCRVIRSRYKEGGKLCLMTHNPRHDFQIVQQKVTISLITYPILFIDHCDAMSQWETRNYSRSIYHLSSISTTRLFLHFVPVTNNID